MMDLVVVRLEKISSGPKIFSLNSLIVIIWIYNNRQKVVQCRNQWVQQDLLGLHSSRPQVKVSFTWCIFRWAPSFKCYGRAIWRSFRWNIRNSWLTKYSIKCNWSDSRLKNAPNDLGNSRWAGGNIRAIYSRARWSWIWSQEEVFWLLWSDKKENWTAKTFLMDK